MPTIHLYVTRDDKEFLDALPLGRTAAAIMREAIARLRADGGCDHVHQMIICPGCGRREYPSLTGEGSEDAGQEGAHGDVHIDGHPRVDV